MTLLLTIADGFTTGSIIFIIVTPFEKRHPTSELAIASFRFARVSQSLSLLTLVIATIGHLPDGGQLPFTSLHLRLLSVILVVLKTSS